MEDMKAKVGPLLKLVDDDTKYQEMRKLKVLWEICVQGILTDISRSSTRSISGFSHGYGNGICVQNVVRPSCAVFFARRGGRGREREPEEFSEIHVLHLKSVCFEVVSEIIAQFELAPDAFDSLFAYAKFQSPLPPPLVYLTPASMFVKV